MIMKNCMNCDYHYCKDLSYDEQDLEIVFICGKDNHYIGYPDEAGERSM